MTRLSEPRFIQAWVATLSKGDVVTFNKKAERLIGMRGDAIVEAINGVVVVTREHGQVNGDWFERPHVIEES